MAPRRPLWKWLCWKSIGFCTQPQTTSTCNLKWQSKLELCSENAVCRVQKSSMDFRRLFLKMPLLKMNRLLLKYTSNGLLKFQFKGKLKLTVREPKNWIWPPSGHFESDITENPKASAHSDKRYAHEIWNWNPKANWIYAPETMSPTVQKRKIRYSRQVAILKMTSLKINWLLPIYTLFTIFIHRPTIDKREHSAKWIIDDR